VSLTPAVPPGWRERLAQATAADWRRWALWAVLALAVIVLAVLARRLMRDIQTPSQDS
jgi:bacteriorhodopsin